MNEILPKIKKETAFDKLKKWLKSVFDKKTVEEVSIEEKINLINRDTRPKNKKSSFIENIQVENKDGIIVLQKRLKDGIIEISDLTDNELDELIDLYEKQIQEKKDKLKYYREKIIKNKKEN